MAKRAGQLQGWRWWAVAFGLAMVVSLVILAVFSVAVHRIPWLRDLVFPPEQRVKRAYSAERIRETADDIRRSAAKGLRLKLDEVQKILAKIADSRDRRAREEVPAGAGKLATDEEKRALDLAIRTGRGLYDLLDAGQTLENACYDAYEGWRAVTLVAQQKIDLARAREVTRVSRPSRRAGRKELLEGDVSTLAAFRKFRKEVIYVKSEVDAILVGAKRIFDLVQDIDAPELGSGQTIAIEMSGTMYQGGDGQVEWGASVGPPLLADEIFASRASSLTQANFHPRPGRKVSDRGEPMDWMFIDRWYCIGPFPNPGRENLDEKFPPESVVDLDAVYEGKHATLRWRLLQSPILCVAPLDVDKYAIYYCWTEISSDEGKDYWLAFGSDDYGKVWINGKLVWASGKQPHHWIPDRGFRKVRLKKGPNQVLFKIENAGGTMGFSLVVRVAPVG